MLPPTPIGQDDVVLSERRGSVMLLTLNRPAKLNAWNTALEDRYFDLLDSADADPDVRAIVVTGAGRGFCAGADMSDLQQVHLLDKDGLPSGARPKSHPLTSASPWSLRSTARQRASDWSRPCSATCASPPPVPSSPPPSPVVA